MPKSIRAVTFPFIAVFLFSLLRASAATGQDLILNEYNAVRSSRWVTASTGATNPGQYISTPFREDAGFAEFPGLPDGRIEGNGGNWWEFVVIQDHLDIRDWEIRWANTHASADQADGINDPWYGDPDVEQGIVTFSNESTWSDLRSGTILTLSTSSSIAVDTDLDGAGNRNFTDPPLPGAADVTMDLSTDTSFDPTSRDWHIHVSSVEEVGSGSPLVTTVHNRVDQGAGFFAAGRRDFQLTILDDSDTVVFGPIGEAISGFASMSDGTGKGFLDGDQVAKLEADPSTSASNAFFQDGGSSTFGLPNIWSGGSEQNFHQLRTSTFVPSLSLLGQLLLAVAVITSARRLH